MRRSLATFQMDISGPRVTDATDASEPEFERIRGKFIGVFLALCTALGFGALVGWSARSFSQVAWWPSYSWFWALYFGVTSACSWHISGWVNHSERPRRIAPSDLLLLAKRQLAWGGAFGLISSFLVVASGQYHSLDVSPIEIITLLALPLNPVFALIYIHLPGQRFIGSPLSRLEPCVLAIGAAALIVLVVGLPLGVL